MANVEKPTHWIKSALVGAACLAGAGYFYWDLTRFEDEGGERRLRQPIAFLYNVAGKWGVVGFFVLCGLASAFFAFQERAKQKAPRR